MQASITLPDISCYAHHGVEEWERNLGQPFLVSLRVWIDIKKAATTDQLSDTIDYVPLHQLVLEQLKGPSVRLLEHLAQKILGTLFDRFKKVSEAYLCIKKPRARLHDYPHPVYLELRLHRDEI